MNNLEYEKIEKFSQQINSHLTDLHGKEQAQIVVETGDQKNLVKTEFDTEKQSINNNNHSNLYAHANHVNFATDKTEK